MTDSHDMLFPKTVRRYLSSDGPWETEWHSIEEIVVRHMWNLNNEERARLVELIESEHYKLCRMQND